MPGDENSSRISGSELHGDTIAAISTPPGRGGIGIVRLSGHEARRIAESMVRLDRPLDPGRARFVVVPDPECSASTATPRVLDEAVVTYFAGPHSYTGEDVVEIAAHGSPVVLEALLREMLRQGARLAEPGEFTQRAFLAGRLDLTQAEAVQDLIAATTLHQVRIAAGQITGAISGLIAPTKQRLIELIALLEAGIDFAEDDLDSAPMAQIEEMIDQIARPLDQLAASFNYGRILREGFTLAIVGRPNAGKSSLFNALLQQNRAIVTPAPGTTRDAITERLSFEGIPVELTDTAGLRESTDEAEMLGIARSRAHLADAAIVLLVVDLTQGLHAEDVAVLAGKPVPPGREDARECLPGAGRLLLVANKTDMFLTEHEISSVLTGLAMEWGHPVHPVSALTGAGMDELRAAIRETLTKDLPGQDTAVITSLRQHAALTAATAALATASAGLRRGLPQEMLLLDLHAALTALDELTGTTTADDILKRIFSTFCIGK